MKRFVYLKNNSVIFFRRLSSSSEQYLLLPKYFPYAQCLLNKGLEQNRLITLCITRRLENLGEGHIEHSSQMFCRLKKNKWSLQNKLNLLCCY